MHSGKYGDQGSKVRSTAWFMLLFYLLPDELPAPGATNRMIAMFDYDRLYRRYLHLLPAFITAADGNIRWDICSTVSTHLGSMLHNLGRVEEGSSVPSGSFLLARASTCWSSGRAFYRGRIAGGRFGRVGGIESQTSPQLSVFFLKLSILLPQFLYFFNELMVILSSEKDTILLSCVICRCGQSELHRI